VEKVGKIKFWIQRLNRWVCYAGMLLILPLMLLTTVDVIGRAAWARPIPGIVELSSYILDIFILLGLAYTQQVKGHVRVSIITSRLPPRAQLFLEILVTLLSLFIIVLLAWQGFVVGFEETAVSDMLRIAQRPFKLLVGVAAFLLCLELVIDLATAFTALKRSA
jgi:TRAP-type mannitol/chloroaromatic compound transport system permease small subunit